MGLSWLRQIYGQMVCVFGVSLSIYHAGYSCSPPMNWRTKSVSKRAVDADIVILGKVVESPFPSRQPPRASKFRQIEHGPYNATFEVICTVKGKHRTKYINVSGFGFIGGHCATSRALRNRTYITFLRTRHGRFSIAEVNMQSGTTPFKTSILRNVIRRISRRRNLVRRSRKLKKSRNGKLNKSRNGCATFLRAARKSAKKRSSEV